MRSEISGEFSRISTAASRPAAVACAIRRCDTNDRRFERKVHQQLLAPLFREEVDDAVQRLVGVVGVQRGQTQMAGFGEGDGVIHRFAFANFADQDDVGRLPQRVLQRHAPAVGVGADLALGDDAVRCSHELIGSSMVMM